MWDFWKALFALFIAMDAIGLLPFYLALTVGLKQEERRKVVWEGILTAFLISALFAFLGQLFFEILGLNLGDFMIAGGIFLLLISILTFTETLQTQEMKSQNFSIVPLGTPLLAGPAVLTTTMMLSSLYGYVITLSALAVVCLISALILLWGDWIKEFLGEGLMKGISKVASLLLASIAIMLIRKGIELIIHSFR
ncbi:MarC family protein [bacterium]|nr:MarC family protein [bacterium]